MNTAQWPQERVVKSMEEIVPKARNEQALNCPRCNSSNTKFCYYNNYSLSQPRHFCKACKRYWTAGGSLRNIPVGGCSRKNKRSSSTSSSSRPSSSSTSFPSSLKNKLPDLVQVLLPPPPPPPPPSTDHQNPKFIHEIRSQDLNMSFPPTHDFKTLSELIQVPNFDIMSNKNNSYMSSSHQHHHHQQHHQQPSALELLSGISSSSREGLNPCSFMQSSMDPSMINYSSGFNNSLQEFKPSLSFSLDGFGSSGTLHGVQETSSASGRHLFQFKDHLKQVSNTSTGHGGDQHNINNNIRDHSNGYWNGMLGGGGGGGGGTGSWI